MVLNLLKLSSSEEESKKSLQVSKESLKINNQDHINTLRQIQKINQENEASINLSNLKIQVSENVNY